MVLRNLSCYHISEIMERMSQIPSLPWPFMCGPRYVAKGAMYKGLGVSPVDLGDSPRKLGVKFNGWGLLGTVDASTPYPT